ncbi:unnamed protein product [Didymodactylos carnosus]|uniref:Uncharacterized protein n=1 Tax=Didymodactylos carnosus TaxID=1234261 RepID=A0A814V9E2_9BILA|nr:unnamed protein product [Didymodactylos carnosus]CAF3948141.1 unnamed protein product [Didymodactylos carnosus]
MVLGNGPAVIWLDAHIGAEGNNRDMKKLFNDQVSASLELPPINEVDALICGYVDDWRAVGAPVKATDTVEKAEALIAEFQDKDVKFICSATLGRLIIPKLVKQFPHILSYYIFCGNISLHLDWAMDYIDCLQMFDHEDNLLARLTKDIAIDFRKHGNHYQELNNLERANECFQHAQTLEERSNKRVGPHHVRDVNYRDA